MSSACQHLKFPHPCRHKTALKSRPRDNEFRWPVLGSNPHPRLRSCGCRTHSLKGAVVGNKPTPSNGLWFNPLPHVTILRSSSSAAYKDM